MNLFLCNTNEWNEWKKNNNNWFEEISNQCKNPSAPVVYLFNNFTKLKDCLSNDITKEALDNWRIKFSTEKSLDEFILNKIKTLQLKLLDNNQHINVIGELPKILKLIEPKYNFNIKQLELNKSHLFNIKNTDTVINEYSLLIFKQNKSFNKLYSVNDINWFTDDTFVQSGSNHRRYADVYIQNMNDELHKHSTLYVMSKYIPKTFDAYIKRIDSAEQLRYKNNTTTFVQHEQILKDLSFSLPNKEKIKMFYSLLVKKPQESQNTIDFNEFSLN